ncbi:MAG: gliding motility-associated ABC transporter substrate-binding protein GldG [Candidatus Azobacteroides sp.]|nr:gliding motility-associated ABC transporter substrate-binding protein GldG [Candidatus Azobacteroides sp.]
MDWKQEYKSWTCLLSKELRTSIYSLSGIIFMFLFLAISGCLLWIVPGEYNIPDNGYAALSPFFNIAPILLLFLIPALSMRSFAEEKRMHTFTLLRSRPVSLSAIASAKIAAISLTVAAAILPTLLYAVCIYFYGNPVGNLDWGSVAASYIGLLFLVWAFVCLSVWASSLASNQLIALIIGMLLCSFFYYGFNLAGMEKLGFLYHYQSVRRGLIETQDVCYFLLISWIAAALIVPSLLSFQRSFTNIQRWAVPIGLLLFILLGLCFSFRFDWTKDKRYTLSPISKNILKRIESPLHVEIYLTGKLPPGFRRLQESTLNLLNDFSTQAPQTIDYQLVDPYRQKKDFIAGLKEEGIQGISVNERTANGKITQNVIFPYALIRSRENQIPVPLLVHSMGRSGEENLNLSREMLEYQFAHAIQLITNKKPQRIAFLEGQDEWPEASVSEITDYLSYEYTIDRGKLSGRPNELNIYDLVIVAGPQTLFSENDKFVLDQYLMQGGKLLWLVNGVKIHSRDELVQKGETTSMANDLNLNDLFFTYGIRIDPVVLQDAQCLFFPVAVENESGQTDYVSKPWYYSPLLVPAPAAEITKGLSWVKTEFASVLSFVGDGAKRKEILLTSSPHAHTLTVPASISFAETDRKPDKQYFSESNFPVAALLHAPFTSAFKNRSAFFAKNGDVFLAESQPTAQMIVVASDEIIHDLQDYDAYSQTAFANKDFLLNCVNYLTDTVGVSTLKAKSLQMQLLNKQALQEHYPQVVFINVIFPPLLLIACIGILNGIRRRKYRTDNLIFESSLNSQE